MLESRHAVRRVKERTPALLFSRVCQKSGGEWQWNASAVLRNIQDKLTESHRMKEDFELLDGPVIPFRAEIYFNPISTKDERRLNQFGTKGLP